MRCDLFCAKRANRCAVVAGVKGDIDLRAFAVDQRSCIDRLLIDQRRRPKPPDDPDERDGGECDELDERDGGEYEEPEDERDGGEYEEPLERGVGLLRAGG